MNDANSFYVGHCAVYWSLSEGYGYYICTHARFGWVFSVIERRWPPTVRRRHEDGSEYLVRRTVSGCIQLLSGLGAGAAIIALLIAWQLYKGPVSLSFLTPYVEQALNSGHRSFKLAIDDTTLTWAGWDRAIELRVKNVRAIGDSGEAVARIPELSVSLSGAALIRGQLAPKNIELLGLALRINRAEDGTLDVEVASKNAPTEPNIAEGLLGWLMKKPDPGSPMSYLQTVRISGATMTYDDRVTGRAWQAPVGYLRLDRAPHGLIAEGSVLIDVEGRVADIALNGSFHSDSQRLDVTATFNEMSPASFAALDPMFTPFRAIDLPLSGTFVVGMTLGGAVETIGFNVEGAAGTLYLPDPFAVPVGVERLALRGLFSGNTGMVSLDQVDVVFAEGAALTLPAPISHTFPITDAALKATYNAGSGVAEIKDMSIGLDGPRVTVKGTVSGIDMNETPMTVKAEATLNDVPVPELKTYWPANLGSDAYDWVTEHLTEGIMQTATAALDVTVQPDGSYVLNSLDGTMAADGVKVIYLQGMPAVTGAAGQMTFDAKTFNVVIEKGETGAVKINGGTVHINGLDEVDQYLDVAIAIDTPVRDGLQIIDHEPLGFAKAVGIDPAKTEGAASIDLSLNLLLAKDLAMDDVKVAAQANLTGVAIDNVVLGRGIRDGNLHLDVNKQRMKVEGSVQMGAIPVNLVWEDRFEDGAPYDSRYLMSARIDDVNDVRDLGVDPGALASDMISGGIDAEIGYTVFDKRTARLEVGADITRAEIRVPALDWRKDGGDSGHADVTILLENGLIKSVPKFEVTSRDLSVQGDIVYSAGGLGLERVNLKRVLFGRTDVSGAVIARADGSWEVGLQGGELDFAPLWDRVMNDRPGKKTDIPDITIVVEIDKLWTDKQRFLGEVSGTFVHKRDIWRTVLVDSKINGQSQLNIDMAPDASGNRVLGVTAENAGDALRFFDLFKNMYGGRLEIRGQYDDAAPTRPLNGKLRVVDYRVRKAPLMTRILSIMALTGIVDAMTGEGLNFDELDVPFTVLDGELRIREAKATGTSIGFTASGIIYTHADVINLQGTVVPVYAVNSFLGKIPLLGNIFTGNEEGGGIFAANFNVTGPIEDPTTSVNPLSALTPGILRNLFGVIGSRGNPGPLSDPLPDGGVLIQ
tara:strand:- start:97966 stop:101424 length:3459 start_codon:yes stop_codon:yes gene_type:complete